ncbi:hypothetical protein TSL6_13580 [Sulfurovum sp. TSL6]|uniref:glycosyltransferase n=1 Tax=Sulfurovum sp. TSL6 TaxID=2826995 RepID=UPI001CC54E01|nr:glycosyltransferase [Sulfurovum sp. TSL6]GIU00852.1 hypothetical protein TSL6_13580 [Sulfurovum sp. TSL6]
MKIAYFINTFKSINWGGQATSSGIEYMLNHTYPEAQFVPLDLPVLPFKKIKILRKYYEYKLVKSIMMDDLEQVYYYLKKMNISSTLFDGFSHICFNGEGAVHSKSGHIRVFMGLLYIAKKQGKVVAAINQTIDLNDEPILEAVLSKVYNSVDFVSVREPISYEYAIKIGIRNVKLIPDAVYGLPKMDKYEINEIVSKYQVPDRYITVTGSSILKRDKKSLIQVKKIIQYLQEYFHMPIVFMANAKTDIWIAHKLENEFNLTIIEPPTKYQDAMAIIANAEILVGGRQHPNIFAYIYEVPYVPFSGNTFKNEGVAKLQNYPLVPLSWNTNKYKLFNAIEKVYKNKNIFPTVYIDDFKIFGESLNSSPSVNSKSIAIVVTNLAGSGGEKVAMAQAKLFREKGHYVVLFLLEDVQTYDTSHFDFPIVALTKYKNMYKGLGKVGDYTYAKILESKMKQFGEFDIVFSNLPRADRAVKLLNHSNKYFVIHTSYRTEIDKFKSLRANNKLKLYREIYHNENLVTISRGMIEDFHELGIHYKSIKTIYNPFDIQEIRKKGYEEVALDYEYIISASAFRKGKRYDMMLDAFKMVKKDIKLLILSKANTKLKEMIKERGLEDKVVIAGFQQNPYKYIKNARLLLLSSDREGLPTVVIESLILGTPVISTDCPTGPREILTDELADWLVPVGDPQALAIKIDEAFASDICIKDESIEKFDQETIYHEYKTLWDK